MTESKTIETIHQAIRRLLDDGLDPEVAADKALASVPRARLAEFAHPLAVAEARREARHRTRRIENAAFARPPAEHLSTPMTGAPVGGPRLTSAEARQALVVERFVTPDGRWVTWGGATAEDHKARAEWQRGHATACITDASRHEAAARLIKSRKATCLDDIDGWADLLQDAA